MDLPFEGMSSLLMAAVRSVPGMFSWPDLHRIMEVNKFLNFHALYECRFEPVELHKKGSWMAPKGSLTGLRTDYYGHLAQAKRTPFLFERFKFLIDNRINYDYSFSTTNNAYNDLLYLAILEKDLPAIKFLLALDHPIEREFKKETYGIQPSYLSAAVRSKNNEILDVVLAAMKAKGAIPTETDNTNHFNELVRKPEGWDSKWDDQPAAVLSLLKVGYPIHWGFEGSDYINWCFEQYFFDYHYDLQIVKTVLDYFLAEKIPIPQELVEKTMMLAIIHRKFALINHLLQFPFRPMMIHENNYDIDWSDDESDYGSDDGHRHSRFSRRRPTGKGGLYCGLPWEISVYSLALMYGVKSILEFIPAEA